MQEPCSLLSNKSCFCVYARVYMFVFMFVHKQVKFLYWMMVVRSILTLVTMSVSLTLHFAVTTTLRQERFINTSLRKREMEII